MRFFLGTKKWDHFVKSRDEEDSKKVKESNKLRSLPEKVFSDGLNSWELEKLLTNVLKSIDKEMKEPFTFHEEAMESQIKFVSVEMRY